jgi:hypothetical protein
MCVHAILRDEESCAYIHIFRISWFILDLCVVSLQVEDSSMIIGVGLSIKEKREIFLYNNLCDHMIHKGYKNSPFG